MTSVQQQAIPAIMSGRDAMVKSQTGSGKDRHGEDINGKKNATFTVYIADID